MKQCRICSENAHGYGIYCNKHTIRHQRHGHPTQATITKHRLVPLLKRVEARREKNADKLLWDNIEARWLALVADARDIMAGYFSGKASPTYEREAASALIKVASEVEPQGVVDTVIALYLLGKDNPRIFVDDRAFRFQLARRVRGLSALNAGVWNNPNTGKASRTNHEFSPRAAEVFSRWLTGHLGVVGVHIADLERKEDAAKRGANDAFRQAVKKIA